eukprot:284807-Karenia_brevis.AAC.1
MWLLPPSGEVSRPGQLFQCNRRSRVEPFPQTVLVKTLRYSGGACHNGPCIANILGYKSSNGYG